MRTNDDDMSQSRGSITPIVPLGSVVQAFFSPPLMVMMERKIKFGKKKVDFGTDEKKVEREFSHTPFGSSHSSFTR